MLSKHLYPFTLLVLGLGLTSCAMADMTRQAFSGASEAQMLRSVDTKANEVADEIQKPFQHRIQEFLAQARGNKISIGKSVDKQATAFFASAAKRNGHALVTGAGSILLSEAHVGNSYIQINVYREEYLEKALSYYQQITEKKGGRFAHNENYVLYTDKIYSNTEATFALFKQYQFK